MPARPVLALTPGEPAGVGPDVALQWTTVTPSDFDLVLIADPAMLEARAARLGMAFSAKPWPGQGGNQPAVYVEPVAVRAPVQTGLLDPANSAYVMECLRRAVRGCRNAEYAALITGPVHKGVINDAGIPFTGHTEFLAAEAGVQQVVMMLAAPGLRVALATTHLPLAEVSRAITRQHLSGVLTILHADLRQKFAIPDPVILV
jgi:4-hydroxythreonine-4-phosphate dehydrogenase